MKEAADFDRELDDSYRFEGEAMVLGAGMFNGEVRNRHLVKIPLKTMNRHGLIAGATGTGKTKSLQVLAESLSGLGVPVLMMDVKGDLSGLASAGAAHSKIAERAAAIGISWQPNNFPVEMLSLSGKQGVRLRATVTEFGPVLFSRILGLNETQSSVMAVIFKYADDKKLPLLDLADLRALMQFMGNEGKEEVKQWYGNISSSTVATILRKIIELEQQGAAVFFGEPSFDPHDLVRTDASGRGIISIIRLHDLQDRPKLFSTFMLSLLAEIYATFPEEGDPDKPKLVLFIDEAHLVFEEATRELLDQMETTIKLIRSKAVGIFFCTQNPQDIPAAVLSQLGLKVQHALRAFTAGDRSTIRKAAENFPESEYYKVDELLTKMGIGEALVTALNEKGIPTMLVQTLMSPPASRMDVLTDPEIESLVAASSLGKKYNQALDRQSAFELLQERMKKMETVETATPAPKRPDKQKPSSFDQVLKSPVVRSIGVTVAGAITRGILGSLGLKTRSTSSRKRR